MKTTPASLTWPGEDLPAALTDRGWDLVRPIADLPFAIEAAPFEDAGNRAMVVRGQRLAVLRALAPVAGGRIALAYLDVPRLQHATFARPQLRYATWLSLLRSHVRETVALVREGGRVVVHVDDDGAAFAMAVLDDLLGSDRREATILWQKKYAPQNDLRGRVDDAQDYLLVYFVGETPGGRRLEKTWWPWEYAGKSEDGTREAEELRERGIVTLPSIPKTSKPAKLVERLLDAYTSAGDLVLEAFSDTGFASAVAVAKGRTPVLLAGDRPDELDRLERCSLPRLVHAAGGAEGVVALHEVATPTYRPAQVVARDNPIQYRVPSTDANDRGAAGNREIRPIHLTVVGTRAGGDDRIAVPSMLIEESSVGRAGAALEPVVGCGVRFAILDRTAGRVEAREPSLEFLPELRAASRLLDEEGVVAVAVDPVDYGRARLVGQLHAFGLDHYLGTLAVHDEKGRGGTEYRLVLLFKGLPDARQDKIGLLAERNYEAEDGDPRGAWRDPGHKGARSGGQNTAFEYRLPPYRWELVDGELPTGAWRLNPISGVIWANRLERAGTYRFRVRVSDASGRSSVANCEIEVQEAGTPPRPDRVWWLEADALPTSQGSPEVVDTILPKGVVGHPYSAVLKATGGTPIDGTTAPGRPTSDGRRTRYWEFAYNTLVDAILEDRVLFGSTGRARPRIKVYEGAETATTVVELSWWDATRLGPESWLERLVRIFTRDEDLVLVSAPGDPTVGRTVLALQRRCIQLIEPGTSSDPGEFPFVGRIGSSVAEWNPETRVFRPRYDVDRFEVGLAWSLGFLPRDVGGAAVDLPGELAERLVGVSPDGREALVYLAPDEWPTRGLCEGLAGVMTSRFARTHVLYYRGDPPKGISGLSFRRVPFDLAGVR